MSLPIHPVAHSLAAGRGGVASLAGTPRAGRAEQTRKAAREAVERDEKSIASDGPVDAIDAADAVSPDLPREEVADQVRRARLDVRA